LRVQATSFLEGLPTRDWFMFDMFAADGSAMTLGFARRMRRSVLCELDEARFRSLTLNGMDVRNCLFHRADSYGEAHLYGGLVDFVNADNPSGVYGNHCENFDIFPAVVACVKPHSFFATNIHTNPWRYVANWFLWGWRNYPERAWHVLSNKDRYPEWFAKRVEFYGRNVLGIDEAVDRYSSEFETLGWKAEAIRRVNRGGGLWYVLFELRRWVGDE
jgi:hypothetical protein